jgi:hypothetical protein
MAARRVSEAAFAELIRDRLIDTEQVREMLGLRTSVGVMHRVDHGWYTGPVVTRRRGYALWDRVQVEREEAARLKAVSHKAS